MPLLSPVSLLRALSLGYWTLRARCEFFLRGIAWPENLTIRGPMGISCARSGHLSMGRGLTFLGNSSFNRAGINHPPQLVVGPNAKLMLGDYVGMSGGSIYCLNQIELGDHIQLGANCNIYDTDFHSLQYQDRRDGVTAASAPVLIEDDVWLCANVTVLKGVRIGARTVVATGSVVTCDLPADCLAAGVPARVIRKLDNSRRDGAESRAA